MNTERTVFSQLLDFLPKRQFDLQLAMVTQDSCILKSFIKSTYSHNRELRLPLLGIIAYFAVYLAERLTLLLTLTPLENSR